nr:hypothetical protein [Tanacetum cinerariifolium]
YSAATRIFGGVTIAVSTPVSAASTIIPTAEAKVPTAAPVKSKDKGKGKMVEEPKPIKKKQQVEIDEAYARKLHKELNQDIDWDVTIEHVKQKAKKDTFVQRYQFKGMSYDDIHPIFEANFNTNMEFLLKSKEQIEEQENKALESINETLAQKAAKRRKMNEDVEDLKQHLEIVPDEDDDLYVSFITLLNNFDRKDLESLWSIVKDRFSTSKPNNISDVYLLTTLRAMFGRPDGQDNVWKSQRSVHGQAMVKSWKLLTSCGVHIISFTTTQLILLVERRYPLLKFTLDQMLNIVRLQVEEQSEMSLELLSLKKNTKCFNAAGEELSAVKHKLMLLDTAAEGRVNTAKRS